MKSFPSSNAEWRNRCNAAGLRGVTHPEFRDVKALSGTQKRDYAYEQFWVAFPLFGEEGRSLIERPGEIELIVRIAGKEGRVSWPVPASIRKRAQNP